MILGTARTAIRFDEDGVLPTDREALTAAEIAARTGGALEWQKVGYLRFRLGDSTGADEALALADSIDPTQTYTAYLRGVIAETRHEYAAATRFYSTALERAPADAAARDALAAVQARISATERFADARDAAHRDLSLATGIALTLLVMIALATRTRRRRNDPAGSASEPAGS
jgi:tetratricopeptide (TPR) repeat protein